MSPGLAQSPMKRSSQARFLGHKYGSPYKDKGRPTTKEENAMEVQAPMEGKISEVAARIRELREIMGLSTEEMAARTDVTHEEYLDFESGKSDFHFTFIYKCSLVFGVDLTDLMEGRSARLSSYTVTRAGQGQLTVQEGGIEIRNLAPAFRNRIAEPHWVRYAYDPDEQDCPIELVTHSGQEFDFILSGKLKIQVGDHAEILGSGDSI